MGFHPQRSQSNFLIKIKAYQIKKEKQIKQVINFQLAKKCKKVIKCQQSHLKEVYIFNRLVASDISSLIQKEFQQNQKNQENPFQAFDIYAMIENQIKSKSKISNRLKIYMNNVEQKFEIPDQPKINREHYIENLKSNLLRWNKNRDQIQGFPDKNQPPQKKSTRELSPIKSIKQPDNNSQNTQLINQKYIKQFENQNEILNMFYDESDLQEKENYQAYFENQVLFQVDKQQKISLIVLGYKNDLSACSLRCN